MTADTWQDFRTDPNPLAQIRPLRVALRAVAGPGNAPGLNALYREARERGSVFGVPVLTCGSKIYIPRAPLVATIEGTYWGPREGDQKEEVAG